MRSQSKDLMEVCVSDNGSSDNTEEVVRLAQQKMPIKYNKNPVNLGIPQNFINVVAMSTGKFAWLIGDDDLLMPNMLDSLLALFTKNPVVDFFYINTFHLHTEYVLSFPQPFDTQNLPSNLEPFSSYKKSGPIPFLDLINPAISFDFLGGMFLSVFRRDKWLENVKELDTKAINDMRTFSHFDNTFPHIKIFSKAFANSTAYFNAEPLSVCLTGAREWSPMYPFVHSVRLVEALGEYRKNGLGLFKYLWCRNFALNSFIPDIMSMYLYRKISGFQYVNPIKLILSNCLFPNFYLSVIYYFIRKFKSFLGKKFK